MEQALVGKKYVVTGATSGIGLATAAELVTRGAMVIGVGRNAARCREAENRLRALSPQARVVYRVADLALQSQVRALAREIQQILAVEALPGLDGLVNNAATFTYWLALTPEGFETQWAVNHLAPFLLTHLLLPQLLAAPAARVVIVSSDSHYAGRLDWQDLQLRRHYDGLRAYENTKLANVLFTREFNRRAAGRTSVRAYAADPGLVKTEIGFKGTPALVRWLWQLRRAGGVAPEQPARGIVYLLCAPALERAGAEYWKDGRPKRAGQNSQDERAAARLWEQSQRMCDME